MVNKEFIVAGIKNLLRRNYAIDPQTVDVEAYVDSTLEFGENWTIIKEMVNAHSISYDLLKCRYCNYTKRADWKYCPMCANPLEENSNSVIKSLNNST
jgi:lipopolysaccharide biosynthesis regulator YciM